MNLEYKFFKLSRDLAKSPDASLQSGKFSGHRHRGSASIRGFSLSRDFAKPCDQRLREKATQPCD